MNTETLIHELLLDCRPVKPVAHPIVGFFKWIVATIASVSAGVFILRPQPDVWNQLLDPVFVLPAVVLFFISFVCGLSAFLLVIPDSPVVRFDVIAVVAIVIWFVFVGYLIVSSDVADAQFGIACTLKMIGLAIFPAALMFFMLKKAFPMNPGLIGLLAVFGALGFAEVGVQFICRKTFAAHIILWHFLPLCALTFLGIVIGRKTFRWNVKRRLD
jgi:hypothetical protein